MDASVEHSFCVLQQHGYSILDSAGGRATGAGSLRTRIWVRAFAWRKVGTWLGGWLGFGSGLRCALPASVLHLSQPCLGI